ncbi:uncharacterized protein LOC112466424 [Temnothorax curvispinosus]|uniref:Uncharacterized protein LOC112466424 n=1 Tax=Temnothorax curvispinosus TaxID=300111 RepID=A0A6J1R5H9_9HYME|nr:uncharacterized protein LOC112466424 [Temnothorax curvispinosus]
MQLIAIALCLSAVLCTVYAIPLKDNLERPRLEVRSAIRNVESTLQRVERVHADTKEDTVVTVIRRFWEQMDSHRDYVDQILESMRREVNNAKFRGVDAKDCYDTNRQAIIEHTDVANKAAAECQENAEKSIENSLGFLESFISVGNNLIEELNDLIRDCHSDDTMKEDSCILIEFAKVNTDVKQFEEDVKHIESSALPVSNYVVLKATECLDEAYLLARFESEGAMMSNSRCVRDALDKEDRYDLVA